MKNKTSIRYFNDMPVRASWDEETSLWLYSAVDIVYVLTHSKSPRKYWNMFKKRNEEIVAFCKQRKMISSDGKYYLSETINEDGINYLLMSIPSKYKMSFTLLV